jgi:hypothetical protein
MKKILTTLVLFFCTGLSFGLYQYFKPPVNLKNLKAEIVLSAAELKEQLATNTLAINELSNKVILVEGTVSSVEKGDHVTIIIDSSIRGEFDKNTEISQVGQEVQIKGMLAGYDEIFEEVVLVKCQLEK